MSEETSMNPENIPDSVSSHSVSDEFQVAVFKLLLEQSTEPVTRWRNWWRLYLPTFVRCNTCGTFHRSPDGALFDYGGCCQTYESRFEAELNAKEDYDPSCDQAKVEWLGAYPEGERP